MLDLYFSLLGLYVFVAAGFFLKKKFGEELNTKSLLLVTIYVMQPILGFWGFTQAPLDWDIAGVGALHLLTGIFVATGILMGIKFWQKDPKMRTILSFVGTSGNTGNMGIPLASLFFGPLGVVVATMINFWNIIWNFTFGVYFFARGKFSIKKAALEIFKIPLMWASFAGVLVNIYGVEFTGKPEYFLELGAYCSIVMQLLLLGIYMASIKIKHFHWGINIWVLVVKFLWMPLVGFGLLALYQIFFGEIAEVILGVAMLQLLVPLATTNGNFATLYDCYPEKVSETILATYVVFLLLVPLGWGLVLGG